METADILEKAAEVLDARGWCQGHYQDDQGQLCAVGAIRVATWGTARWDHSNAVEYLASRMAQEAMSAHLGVEDIAVGWNDRPGRTKDEVIDTFKHAAKELRNNA